MTLLPLANDTPGLAADGTAGTWDVSSLVFPNFGQPADAMPELAGKELVVPGEGTYTIDEDGVVTFDPLPSFSGTASPVTYQVTDSLGNLATATITVTVTAVTPTALDDSARTPSAEPVVIDVLDSTGTTYPLPKLGTLTSAEASPFGTYLGCSLVPPSVHWVRSDSMVLSCARCASHLVPQNCQPTHPSISTPTSISTSPTHRPRRRPRDRVSTTGPVCWTGRPRSGSVRSGLVSRVVNPSWWAN